MLSQVALSNDKGTVKVKPGQNIKSKYPIQAQFDNFTAQTKAGTVWTVCLDDSVLIPIDDLNSLDQNNFSAHLDSNVLFEYAKVIEKRSRKTRKLPPVLLRSGRNATSSSPRRSFCDGLYVTS